MKWKYTWRRINGRMVRVKVHRKGDGGYLVRRVGYRNTSDKSTPNRKIRRGR